MILVQLRDPAVQRAQTIADLLPVENVAVAQQLAAELVATNGRGILWVLDGWDELPTHLQQDSIFCELLLPKPSKEKFAEIKQDPDYFVEHVLLKCSEKELWNMYLQKNPAVRTQYCKDRLLNEASVIVTSRPISSGDLYPVVSSRIEVLGFTPEEQRQYFTEYLKGDTKALEALLEKIQENPVLQSICYLPLNAALTVHCFKVNGNSLPSTEYEIFSTVLFYSICRHLKRDQELTVELGSFDDLSKCEAVRKPFQCLCELAYRGVIENKVAFSSSDLSQGSNTLGLLQAIESFLQNGKAMFYNFVHLSFQELLAGYYIATCLPDSEQVSQFQQLFHQPRFLSVFRFYTAITKLKSPGINEVITEIVSMGSRLTYGSKPQLFSLLHCLYEAQDPLLCQFVAEQLNIICGGFSTPTPGPLDLLSIGYLISVSNTSVVKKVYIKNHHLGDCGVKILMKHIICGKGVGCWKFDMGLNRIHEEGAASIAKALQCSDVINSLDLTLNPIGGEGLQSIAEALITNTTLVTLNLFGCSLEITEENGPVVTEMLQRNKTLKELDLIMTRISDTGVYFIAEGLKNNSALKCLSMTGAHEQHLVGKALATATATTASLVTLKTIRITEDSGAVLGDMFRQNKSLERVLLHKVSKIGIPYIAQGLQQNSTLKELAIKNTSMTSSEAMALSVMLIINETLTSVNLHGSQIGDDGAAHLAKALRKNKSLQKLVLSWCDITDAGLASLADALRVNNSLSELNLEGNALTEKGVTYSESVLSHRSAIIHHQAPELFYDEGPSLLHISESHFGKRK